MHNQHDDVLNTQCPDFNKSKLKLLTASNETVDLPDRKSREGVFLIPCPVPIIQFHISASLTALQTDYTMGLLSLLHWRIPQAAAVESDMPKTSLTLFFKRASFERDSHLVRVTYSNSKEYRKLVCNGIRILRKTFRNDYLQVPTEFGILGAVAGYTRIREVQHLSDHSQYFRYTIRHQFSSLDKLILSD